MDLSAQMLEAAHAKLAGHPSVTFVQAPAPALPFEAGSFDDDVSANAFH